MKNIFKFKKGHFVIALMMITTLSACDSDFLDRQAQGDYNQDNYPYPGGSGPYDQFINSAYASLRSYNVTVMPFLAAVSIRSDDADKGSTPSDGPEVLQMDNFTINAANGLANALWSGHINLIADCNFILDRIKNDPNPNTPINLKTDAEAQAKFLRGYAYFMMVRLYGRVPIIDSITTSSAGSANVPQSSPAQVYAFIESDLQFAAANLAPTFDPKFTGRITVGAANGLLAKVYLTQGKWAQAMSAANLVMTSPQYDLSVPYNVVFNEEGENSKESIFEVQATANAANPTAFGSQYSQVQGVRGTGDWNLGWGFNVPSTSLEAAYEEGDPRKARTILYTGGTSLFGEPVPAGLPNPRYNNKVSTPRARQNEVGSRSAWWMNVRLLRYADVVLMYAEAATELGGADNITKALAALNSVRERARRNAPAGTLPNIITIDQAELRQAIRQERRVELGMEHERFFDIVRWGIAAQVLHAQGKAFVTGKHKLLPIPQAQIDISAGVLTQNPGY